MKFKVGDLAFVNQSCQAYYAEHRSSIIEKGTLVVIAGHRFISEHDDWCSMFIIMNEMRMWIYTRCLSPIIDEANEYI